MRSATREFFLSHPSMDGEGHARKHKSHTAFHQTFAKQIRLSIATANFLLNGGLAPKNPSWALVFAHDALYSMLCPPNISGARHITEKLAIWAMPDIKSRIPWAVGEIEALRKARSSVLYGEGMDIPYAKMVEHVLLGAYLSRMFERAQVTPAVPSGRRPSLHPMLQVAVHLISGQGGCDEYSAKLSHAASFAAIRRNLCLILIMNAAFSINCIKNIGTAELFRRAQEFESRLGEWADKESILAFRKARNMVLHRAQFDAVGGEMAHDSFELARHLRHLIGKRLAQPRNRSTFHTFLPYQ